jgi:DNA-binding NarL/FixJ family response regulator
MSPTIARRVLQTFRERQPKEVRAAAAISDREREVLVLLSQGHSYQTAAGQLGLSLDTVRSHVKNIYSKLHVHTQAEAVSKALRAGMIR